MARTALLSALAGAVIAADWLRLEEPQRVSGRTAVLVAIAIGPALVLRRWLRVLCAIAGAFAALAIAFSVSPSGTDFFSRIVDRFASGFVDFYAFRLPVHPDVQPRMHMLILLAVFTFNTLPPPNAPTTRLTRTSPVDSSTRTSQNCAPNA